MWQNWPFQNGDYVFEADVDWNTSAYIVSYTPTRSGLYNLSAVFATNGSFFHVSGSPFLLFVRPSENVSAGNSVAYGVGLTLSTIGVRSYFTITPRDKYDGIQFPDYPKFRISILGIAQPLSFDLDIVLGFGYMVSYMPLTKGDLGLELCTPVGNGFHAEYYADTNFMTSILHRTDEEIDFTWQRGRPGTDLFVQSRKPGLSFAVRWTGFLSSRLNQIHTISVDLLESDERVRMWFDDSMILDQVWCYILND